MTYCLYSFELYERNGGREKSDKEYSIKLSLSEGAHSSNVLDSAVDARHSLNVTARRYLMFVVRTTFYMGTLTNLLLIGNSPNTFLIRWL